MSLFSLPREPAPSTDVTSWYFQRVESSSAINTNPQQLAGSTIRFHVQPSGRRWFVPARSYFKVRFTIDPGLLPLGVAPTMGFGGNLFRTAEVRIGGTTVSQINTNMAQIDAMNARSKKASSWLDGTGNVLNKWDGNYTNARGIEAAKADQEIDWTPPLGFFNIDHGLPGMNYDISLTVNPQFQTQCVTSISNADEAGNYVLSITEISFHAAFVEGPRADDEKFVLNINEWTCQNQVINNSASDTLNQFDVAPSTNVLAVAFQDTRLSDTRVSASRFRVLDSVTPDPTTADPYGRELKLNNFYLEYGGKQYPNRFASPNYSPTAQQLTQQYLETQLNTGVYFLSGGGERLAAYIARGPYLFYQTPKDATDQSTRVHVHSTFSDAIANMNCLLFSRAPKAYLVRTSDSRVVQVEGTINSVRQR